MPRRLPWIEPDDPPGAFPPLHRALRDPDGLLAVGGDLSPARLLAAYRRGIFPWYSDDQPILWWSPDPRTVLIPERLHRSRSLQRTLRRAPFELRVDSAFDAVIAACAAPRPDAEGTWITPDMQVAYGLLHELGHAHSIECWRDGELVGGIYGLAVGRVFCGESMFSRASDASKVAMVHLCELGFVLIDGQVQSEFLTQLGFEQIRRAEFVELLDRWGDQPGPLSSSA